MEACEVALGFILFFEEILDSCTGFSELVGREVRGRGHYLNKILCFFSKNRYFLRLVY